MGRTLALELMWTERQKAVTIHVGQSIFLVRPNEMHIGAIVVPCVPDGSPDPKLHYVEDAETKDERCKTLRRLCVAFGSRLGALEVLRLLHGIRSKLLSVGQRKSWGLKQGMPLVPGGPGRKCYGIVSPWRFVSFALSWSCLHEAPRTGRNTATRHLLVIVFACVPSSFPWTTMTNVNFMSAPSYGSSAPISLM